MHSGAEIIRFVRARSPKAMLSFSRGKDSIASWLAMRDAFEEVIPFHLYLVPGLEFVEESLAYFERLMGCPIINLPHPSLWRMLNEGVFQPPERMATIHACLMPDYDYEDIRQAVLEKRRDLKHDTMVGVGVRATDSPLRRMAFTTNGGFFPAQHRFWPVCDWNKARVMEAVTKAGIELPIDYWLFNRSFDGIDARFLYPLKAHRPRDYAKILEWFPLAELEVFRLERRL